MASSNSSAHTHYAEQHATADRLRRLDDMRYTMRMRHATTRLTRREETINAHTQARARAHTYAKRYATANRQLVNATETYRSLYAKSCWNYFADSRIVMHQRHRDTVNKFAANKMSITLRVPHIRIYVYIYACNLKYIQPALASRLSPRFLADFSWLLLRAATSVRWPNFRLRRRGRCP